MFTSLVSLHMTPTLLPPKRTTEEMSSGETSGSSTAPPPKVQFAKLSDAIAVRPLRRRRGADRHHVSCTHVAQMAPVESRSMTRVSLFWPSIADGVPAETYLCAPEL